MSIPGLSSVVTTGALLVVLTSACTTSTETRSPTTTSSAPSPVLPGVPAFLPQPPANRGRLDLIGYLTAPGPDGTTIATVYFHAPAVTAQIPPGMTSPPCDIAPRVTGTDTDHVTVDVDLTFSAGSTAANRIMADCWTGDAHQPVVRSYLVGPVRPTAKLFTGMPAPGTPLPRLTEPPR